MYIERMAFDAASQRTKDSNGYLRVAVSHITKETVNPYYGSDIPGWREKGLDPSKIYMGYREGAALKKAAPSFNGLPLLLGHYAESASNPQKEHRVGSLGTDAVFNAPYLDNSIIVTDARAIQLIESGQAKEISAAYRYTPVWQSGVFDGTHYDFIMRDIEGNHVALVKEGRAGHDVVVADSMPETLKGGVAAVKRPTGPIDAIYTALQVMCGNPEIATDEAMTDLFPAMDEDTSAKVETILKFAAKGAAIAEDEKDVNGMAVKRYAKKRGLARDSKAAKAFDEGREYMKKKLAKMSEAEDEEEFDDLPSKKRIDGVGDDEDDTEELPIKKKKPLPEAEDEDEEEERPIEGEDEDEEDAPVAPRKKASRFPIEEDEEDDEFDDAEDEDEDEDTTAAFKNGMQYEKEAYDRRMAHDEQIKRSTVNRLRAMHKAAEECKPLLGRVADPFAFDSAGDIYKKALIKSNVDISGVHPSAYRAMVQLVKKNMSSMNQSVRRPSFAMDEKDDPKMKAIFDGLNSIIKK